MTTLAISAFDNWEPEEQNQWKQWYENPVRLPRRINGHDRCYGGASAGPDCPYCERRPATKPKIDKMHNDLLVKGGILGITRHPWADQFE